MTKSVFLLYEGDEWLSTSSLVLMGVFTSRRKLLAAVRKLVTENVSRYKLYYEVSKRQVVDEVIQEMKENGQTQGRDNNLLFQVADLNVLGEI